jgi:lipopolysaccharide/colanic/teichoic acid biosynthesis glycosyltransferase
MLKFRTMTNHRDSKGQLLPDSERLTPAGRFLRSTSLDELPELVNVVRGQMSLVGPRPLMVRYLPLYSPRQRIRHRVRPGITGLAQVSGRNTLSWPERLELDARYAETLSFRQDIKILILTLARVASRQGITAEGRATAVAFDDNDAMEKGSSTSTTSESVPNEC